MFFNAIDLNDLEIVCSKIYELSKNKSHAIFLLYGDVGVGKTSLIQKYAKFRNIKDCVTSPTFSLMHQYGDKIFHYDFYNKNMQDLLNLGILDLLDNSGIHFIEWANDEIKSILDDAFLDIFSIKIDKNLEKRNYAIS